MEKSNILMYTTEDGVTKVEVTFDNDTVWLSLDQIAYLFQRNKSTISRHIKNIFLEGELSRDSVVANFATTGSDGKRYHVDFYNLDVIISVGYRVKSLRGTQFRIWATVLEIYATSIDYNPKAESSVQFFKQVQNKMHWAAHKHTAAEVIYQRADADKDNMGLTTWSGNLIKRSDVEVAKNYLDEKELDALNKIVTAYLDIAEVHALNQEPMYMKDWLETIDDYLRMTRRDILTTKGKVTHQQAMEKAHLEYEKYKRNQEYILSPVECHFLESIGELENRS